MTLISYDERQRLYLCCLDKLNKERHRNMTLRRIVAYVSIWAAGATMAALWFGWVR